MSYGEIEQRPAKKRRFFVDDVDEPAINPELSLPDEIKPLPASNAGASTGDATDGDAHDTVVGFDADSLEAIVGEKLSNADVEKLSGLSGGNLEQAINLFFDGSWKKTVIPVSTSSFPNENGKLSWRSLSDHNGEGFSSPSRMSSPPPSLKLTEGPQALESMPDKRYIGSFGVTAWATRSGTCLIQYGERITLERVVSQQSMKKAGKLGRMARKDVIVRFKNSKNEEVGRLESETAQWISALLDQKVCRFQGSCVFAPDRIRTSDTIYLQLRCFLLRDTFASGSIIKPLDDNRQAVFFEAKESDDEKALRMRQVGLVKLFDEIKLSPSKTNTDTEKHRRQGLLQAAEMAEKSEQQGSGQVSKVNTENGDSSPPLEEEEGQELEQDQLDSLYKKAQSFDFSTPEAQPADTFNMDLRKYQKQALHWMLGKERDQKADHKQQSMHPLWEEYAWPTKDADDKELPGVEDQPAFYVNPYSGEMSLEFPVQEQNCLGGILADEMGLGKTIEMLSLIHSHRTDNPALESETGGTVNGLTRLPNTSSNVEQAPATTLVVAPMSLLAQWQSEAEKASKPGTLNVMMYYGTEKTANLQSLCCTANAANAPNVIITSYGVVLSEYNQVASAYSGNRGSSGGLFSLDYFRIILDEAHFIKNRQSKTAKACYELRAIHRWVLTGTPIVNRLEDLFSLVHFLRVEPWSNFSFWKTFITVPFESKDFIRALDVVQTVLEPLVLRRTKDMKTPDGEALVPLPPRTINIDHVELSKSEREVYDYIMLRAKRTFAANEANLMKAYTTIFAQILRLRQSCCHPILTRNKNVVADELEAGAAADMANGLADDMDLDVLLEQFEAEEQDANKFGATALKQIQDEAEHECPICFEEPMNQQAVTSCWHSACKDCLLDYIEQQKSKGELPRCFNCREPVTPRDVFEVLRHDVDMEDGDDTGPRISLRRTSAEPSAKIASLLTHLKTLRKSHSGTKSVVFSQFTSFLDLIEPALSRDRIPFLRFDGSMSQKARAAVLNEFSDSNKGTVLLLSLRAGGVGLNLTTAKRVYMMDPWWSFAVEAQAIDRVHRMGQDCAVEVVRFIARGSIEEKMLRIQERKKFM
jgi:DNA repair protein RAD5